MTTPVTGVPFSSVTADFMLCTQCVTIVQILQKDDNAATNKIKESYLSYCKIDLHEIKIKNLSKKGIVLGVFEACMMVLNGWGVSIHSF